MPAWKIFSGVSGINQPSNDVSVTPYCIKRAHLCGYCRIIFDDFLPGKGGISSVTISSIEGKGLEVLGIQMDFIGAGNTLSASTSEYVIFKGQLPGKLFFGISRESFSTEMSGNIFSIGELQQ